MLSVCFLPSDNAVSLCCEITPWWHPPVYSPVVSYYWFMYLAIQFLNEVKFSWYLRELLNHLELYHTNKREGWLILSVIWHCLPYKFFRSKKWFFIFPAQFGWSPDQDMALPDFWSCLLLFQHEDGAQRCLFPVCENCQGKCRASFRSRGN